MDFLPLLELGHPSYPALLLVLQTWVRTCITSVLALGSLDSDWNLCHELSYRLGQNYIIDSSWLPASLKETVECFSPMITRQMFSGISTYFPIGSVSLEKQKVSQCAMGAAAMKWMPTSDTRLY